LNQAHVILKEVPDPERLGCPEFSDGRILGIEEKPKKHKSRFAVTGIYFCDATMFEKIGKTNQADATSWKSPMSTICIWRKER
jgi:dTDP-glucose pyrophosphorylase